NFEYFTSEGIQEVNQLTGSKIFGGCSRERPFKSLSIFARKKYGDNSLSHPFFGSREIEEYKSIILRNAGGDSWRGWIRDGFMQSLLIGKVDVDYQAFQPAIVYLNGEYYGMLNMREKINEHYAAGNYNLDPDQIDMIQTNKRYVVSGSADHYIDLVDFANSNNLYNQDNYSEVASRMDIDEFMNYWLVENYFENFDWPEANIKFWRPQVEGGKWRWVLFDLDLGWGAYTGDGNIMNSTIGKELEWTELIRALLENDGFKHEFIQRMAAFINTIFNPENVTPVFDSIKRIIDPEMGRHIDRWGIPRLKDFDRHINTVMPQFTAERPDEMRDHMSDFFGLSGLYNLTAVVNDSTRGSIQACRVPLPQDFSGLFFKNIPLRLEAIPRSGYTFSHWEGASTSEGGTIFMNLSSDASLTAVFEPDTPVSNISFNEVCASNQSGFADEFGQLDDWIEIYNDNDFNVNLAGWYLSDSAGYELKYQIPSGQPGITTVKAKDYLLIWCDNDPMQGPLHTNFKLKREGESLSLVQKVDQDLHYVDSFHYPELYADLTFGRIQDTGHWEFLEPTPLALNEKVELNGIYINEFQASNCGNFLDEFGEADDWIEIYNLTAEAIDLGGLFLTDSLQDPLKHRIPAGYATTTIQPYGFMVLWADNQPEQGPLHLGFRLNSRSEQLGIYQLSGGYLDSLSYVLDDRGIAAGRYPDGAENLQIISASPGETNRIQFIENIYINEFMANNRSTLSDDSGEFDDWIEIYNDNDFPVDIGGIFVTDSLADPSKYRIPTCHSDSTTIPAKGFLVLWADNHEAQGVLHLDFRLSGDGEEIGLVQPNGMDFIDSISYIDAIPDQAVGRLKDGSSNLQYLSSSPGYANEVRRLDNLFINEYLTSNQSTHTDGYGEYDDWIEIFNANEFQVDIGGLFITDSLEYPARNRIPSGQPDSTTIPPGGFIVLWADGQVEQGVLHLNFKLRSSGEQIGIVQPDGMEFIDSLSYSNLSPDLTMGRLEDGTNNLQIVTASPGFPNFISPTERLYISEIVASGNVSNTDIW
ncbi:MAG: lamin tail domain-containing protein, partial [Bacteroidales bacterium]|nr:lamin tail domain-containing protein [Bacteroidales bacterium]